MKTQARPFLARYPGVCATTGNRYPAGALIQRGAADYFLQSFSLRRRVPAVAGLTSAP